ncbi:MULTISPECIES: DUF1858 domain-containing protein [Jonquetella]|uniref:Hydrid cluster protein-associated redox disulfide domain n=1 Tax=Jonquetella anthropi DSM 22815 TaxID=885272 RepID=H0UIQ8_9BACT|nr:MULTISPECIES: DUF1858 domain-containing protein [Jonquetella]EEX49354.1 hydrid cluster protein-associated redox disulfide domain protein [Jonquetella anthropi E3_33 E1]EHM13803.1 hydrid cluster protein-associated redox disulfide domain [Jonquetella anthropi DSM 22815]ERL24246.1 PF08984 domain protein [Jonquetella sp. BV3C21]
MKITKDMSIASIVEQYPETIPVLQQVGMGCLGCAIAHFENIEQGALAHGIDIEGLIKVLNDTVEGAAR